MVNGEAFADKDAAFKTFKRSVCAAQPAANNIHMAASAGTGVTAGASAVTVHDDMVVNCQDRTEDQRIEDAIQDMTDAQWEELCAAPPAPQTPPPPTPTPEDEDDEYPDDDEE